jgi:leucyl aminopeptidase
MTTYLLNSFIILFSILYAGQQRYTDKNPVVKASELREWISYLASDEMKGRANGSPEMKKAAEWIADKFEENGLKPLPSENGFIQDYTFTSRQNSINERNVIGMIEGTDPRLKDQYLVISAHFDHIGIRRGSKPDSICNGADDNAAGTCTLIGIARTIRMLKLKPGRTIIFAAFSGEENGMRGSRYFVSRAPVPLKDIYTDVNFEMTGHSEYLGPHKYYMTGCKNSNLDDLITEYNKGNDFQLVDTIPIAERLFNSSDNAAFSRIALKDGITEGIPSGTFATTTLADYIHSVDDEPELFDYENMAGLVQYFAHMVIWLSENKTDIVWTDTRFKRPE